MSSTINQQQSFWKTVEATLRSILVEKRADGTTVLTADDAASWSKTLIISSLILQDLLPDGSRLRSDGSLKQWCITIAKEDILTVARAMKEYQLFIRHYPSEWAFLSYADFKHRCNYTFTGAFFAPVRDTFVSFLANPTPATFRIVNQWISFPLKLTLQGLADDLTLKSESEFLENEDRLANLEFSRSDCDNVAAVLKTWFRGLSQAPEFHPHHSNGAVSNRETKKGLYGKYCNMQTDTKIMYLYRKLGLDPEDFGFHRFMNVASMDCVPTAKLITVPKGIDKRRMICPEPAEYQFNQQAVWDILDKYIQDDPYLSRRIAIHDQTVNQKAACLASRNLDAATIDLSSASDSVSWAVVKACFRRCPHLLRLLWATRSTSVRLPSGQIVRTVKYAPMGSALCFPIESILFAAICQVAENSTSLVRGRFNVYGDDIIITQPAYEETCRLLKGFGFLINEQKTFEPYDRFKESCGFEALDGEDVTPIGISRKFSGIPLSVDRPELVSCYVQLCNQLALHSYMRARRYVLSDILALPVDVRPPFSWSATNGIVSSQPTNFTSTKRWNVDLQRDEIRVGVYMSTHDPDPKRTSDSVLRQKFGRFYDEVRYLETLRRLAETKRSGLFWPDDRISVSLGKSRLLMKSNWLPLYAYTAPCGISYDLVGQEPYQNSPKLFT